MTTYLNLHMALEKIRVQAAIPRYDEAGLDVGDEVMPPRLMIVGERNSGKTTVAKSLVNWALRSARTRGGPGSDKPNATGSGITLVNLDPGEVRMSFITVLTHSGRLHDPWDSDGRADLRNAAEHEPSSHLWHDPQHRTAAQLPESAAWRTLAA